MADGYKTEVISLADAMARIEVLEAFVRNLTEIEHADVFDLRTEIDVLTTRVFELEGRLPSATQVAEAA